MKYTVTPIVVAQKQMYAPTTKTMAYTGPTTLKDETLTDKADMTKSTYIVSGISDNSGNCIIKADYTMT